MQRQLDGYSNLNSAVVGQNYHKNEVVNIRKLFPAYPKLQFRGLYRGLPRRSGVELHAVV